MKTYYIFLVAILCLFIGFGSAWFLSKNRNESNPIHDNISNTTSITSDNQTNQTWTCSMHPQIRRDEPGDCPICGMDLIPIEDNVSNNPLELNMTEEAIKLAQIQTSVIGQNQHQGKNLRLTGKIQPDERQRSSLVTHLPGRIEKLYISFTGEQVNKGDKIATIYAPELISAQQELLEALKLQDINPELLEVARRKLSYWKIDNSFITSVEKNRQIKETFNLYAYESGTVAKRRVAVGDYIRQGEALFDLINLERVWVLFDAYEDDLPHIALGDQITFSTPSHPSKRYTTRVTFIDPVINPNTRVASIRAEVNNRYGHLKPDMLVYGDLHQRQQKTENLTTIPKSAVLWTGERSVTYVKVPDTEIPTFAFREIEIGESLGDQYAVLSGLDPGEEVVTNGAFALDAAAQLNNQNSMMNRLVSKAKKDISLPDYASDTPVEFKSQLNTLATQYLPLKDALVAGDVVSASQRAQNVTKQLQNVDMHLLKGEQHMYWMEQMKKIQTHSELITTVDDIEAQRKQFEFVSTALIQSLLVFGAVGDTLYVQHCPMAFDNQGADWLSSEHAIRNPYFGDAMLRCGIVKDTLQ